jgi:hypothetical protein
LEEIVEDCIPPYVNKKLTPTIAFPPKRKAKIDKKSMHVSKHISYSDTKHYSKKSSRPLEEIVEL